MSDRRTCPAPGCTASLPADVYACRAHWFQLPTSIRSSINRAFRRYTADPVRYVHDLTSAQDEAAHWWRHHV